MNVVLHTKRMTRDEFFAWAEGRDGRYEFDGSQPVPMTGGTNTHGLIAGNIYFQLKLRLAGSTCIPMLPEGGGVATIDNRVRYPEATVTCSKITGTDRLIPDPVVVFEVVSTSSARTDQVLKVREYHAVPSIKRYVVLEQTAIAVTVHARQHDEPWATTILLNGDVLAMPELGIEIPIADLYAGTDVSLAEASPTSTPSPAGGRGPG